MKNCPFCGEEILAAAIKCKHCGEFLDDSTRSAPPLIQQPTPLQIKTKARTKAATWGWLFFAVGIGVMCSPIDKMPRVIICVALFWAVFVAGIINLAKRRVGPGLALLLVLPVYLVMFGMTLTRFSPTSRSEPNESSDPQLLVLNWNWRQEYGFAIVEGEVKNISSESMRGVEALAKFYDENGNFITSSDALIEYNPILPGQSSPFKVATTWNPEMKKVGLSFKYLLGGTIASKEKAP